MSTSLLATRRFAPLFWCQFFSALNDNFLKNSLVFLILFHVAGTASAALIQLAAAALVAPFFFLSALGGQIADRFDKAEVAEKLKRVEIAAAAIAVAGFWLHSIPVLFVALVLFGALAALFGPIKYGILPDHLAEGELPAGNALIEGATFLAILIGTIVGGLAAKGGGDPAALSGLMMVLALISWAAARFIPKTGQAAPDLRINPNILASTWDLLVDLKRTPKLWWLALVVSWFWLVGAVVMSLLPPLVKTVLGGSEEVVTLFLAIFSIAIAIGSGLASWLSSHRIVLVPTAIAGVLIGLFAIDLGLATLGATAAAAPVGAIEFLSKSPGLRIAIDLFGLAVAGGLYIVPAFSAMQAWAGKDRRARVVGAANILNALFMTSGAIAVAALAAFGVSVPHIFILLGAVAVGVGFVILKTLPTSAFRDFLSILYRALFRLEVRGLENLAKAGANPILALNHVSFLDAGLALSLLDHDPVFAIDTGIARTWWVKPFVRMTRALPLDPTKPIATRTLINAVKGGDALVIFPEGRLTVTGALMKVYDGAGLIADKSDALVVPIRIEGLERSWLTYLSPKQVRRRLLPKVIVTILEPVKLGLDPALRGRQRRMAAGAALYGIMSDLIYRTTPTGRSVFQAAVASAVEHGVGRIAIEDPLSGKLTMKRMLVGARVLGQQLTPFAPKGGAVGLMLPNANGAAVTLLGLFSAGRVPALINFTAGSANIISACNTAKLTTVITSRAFIERAHLQALVETVGQHVGFVYLEDIRAKIGFADRLGGLINWKKPIETVAADDAAAILFTSGTEGAPKGVVLSHRNILTNAAQAAARIDFGRSDKLFSAMPLFHSFGLTVGMVLPLVSGVPIYLYPTPLHYRIIPELVYGTNSTILFGTDTFLAGYARSAHAYDFRSLRYVIAGAEPVKDATRAVWMEKFGLRILEGYGVTETAPALALNTPMFNRFGTVGRLLPGIAHRLDPVAGIHTGGRLSVHGPNVMLGYLRADNPGVLEPPEGGWHDTGDIVDIDAQGFIKIQGRAKRFAKIGGEMVSLAAVELLAGELWPEARSAVVAQPDARKGERLVLITTQTGADRAAIMGYARSKGASDLMTPAEVRIADKLPLLGSGKVDYVALNAQINTRPKPMVVATPVAASPIAATPVATPPAGTPVG